MLHDKTSLNFKVSLKEISSKRNCEKSRMRSSSSSTSSCDIITRWRRRKERAIHEMLCVIKRPGNAMSKLVFYCHRQSKKEREKTLINIHIVFGIDTLGGDFSCFLLPLLSISLSLLSHSLFHNASLSLHEGDAREFILLEKNEV